MDTLLVDSNCTYFTLNGSEIKIKFTGSYSYIWVENLGSSTIKISKTPGISSQISGVIQRPPKSSVGMQVNDSTIYISGDSGTVNVMGTNSAENPFRINSEGGGGNGSGGVTSYNDLFDKPSINDVVLQGNVTLNDLGISSGENDSNTKPVNFIHLFGTSVQGVGPIIIDYLHPLNSSGIEDLCVVVSSFVERTDGNDVRGFYYVDHSSSDAIDPQNTYARVLPYASGRNTIFSAIVTERDL